MSLFKPLYGLLDPVVNLVDFIYDYQIMTWNENLSHFWLYWIWHSFLQNMMRNTPLFWAVIFSFSGGFLILGNLGFILYADDQPPEWAGNDTEQNLLWLCYWINQVQSFVLNTVENYFITQILYSIKYKVLYGDELFGTLGSDLSESQNCKNE